jgi:hypothetical protein
MPCTEPSQSGHELCHVRSWTIFTSDKSTAWSVAHVTDRTCDRSHDPLLHGFVAFTESDWGGERRSEGRWWHTADSGRARGCAGGGGSAKYRVRVRGCVGAFVAGDYSDGRWGDGWSRRGRHCPVCRKLRWEAAYAEEKHWGASRPAGGRWMR